MISPFSALHQTYNPHFGQQPPRRSEPLWDLVRQQEQHADELAAQKMAMQRDRQAQSRHQENIIQGMVNLSELLTHQYLPPVTRLPNAVEFLETLAQWTGDARLSYEHLLQAAPVVPEIPKKRGVWAVVCGAFSASAAPPERPRPEQLLSELIITEEQLKPQFSEKHWPGVKKMIDDLIRINMLVPVKSFNKNAIPLPYDHQPGVFRLSNLFWNMYQFGLIRDLSSKQIGNLSSNRHLSPDEQREHLQTDVRFKLTERENGVLTFKPLPNELPGVAYFDLSAVEMGFSMASLSDAKDLAAFIKKMIPQSPKTEAEWQDSIKTALKSGDFIGVARNQTGDVVASGFLKNVNQGWANIWGHAIQPGAMGEYGFEKVTRALLAVARQRGFGFARLNVSNPDNLARYQAMGFTALKEPENGRHYLFISTQ